MSYLRYLCLLKYIGVQNIMWCGFVLFVFVLYTQCSQCLFCPFVFFLLAIVLSVLLRYTYSDYPFCINKLFLLSRYLCWWNINPGGYFHPIAAYSALTSIRIHVLFTLFVFAYVYWGPTHNVLCFCFVCLRLVYPILSVSQDCPYKNIRFLFLMKRKFYIVGKGHPLLKHE
jgi:hypothetical protein